MTGYPIELARVRREQIRWFILLTLNQARPVGCYSETVLAVIQASYHDATRLEVHRELDYLEERELVKIERDPTDRWNCDLTRHGVDIVEYAVDVEPGIARPKYQGG